MSDWARRRKTYYGVGFAFFLFTVIGVPTFIALNKPPSCSDGKQNQGETKIDRGGPCKLIDEEVLNPIRILWSRPFLIREGVVNVTAYIDNPNKDSGASRVPYQFRLYDKNNVLIAERSGITPIIPGRVFPIFEGAVTTGYRIPTRAFFSFVQPPIWKKMKDPADNIIVRNIILSKEDTTPRIDAEVHNTNVTERRKVALVAVVFDDVGNAFTSSRTLIERLGPGENKTVAFTWPFKFPFKSARIEISPVVFFGEDL